MKVNYCGRKQQKRMIANGWRIMLAERCSETPEAMYERLTKMGYSQVKVYYDTTCIRGLHSYFAFVKI